MTQDNFLIYYLSDRDIKPFREVCKALKKDVLLKKLEKDENLFSIIYSKKCHALLIDYEIYQTKLAEYLPILPQEEKLPSLAILLVFKEELQIEEVILPNPYIFDYIEYPFDKKRLAFKLSKLFSYLNSRKEVQQLQEQLRLKSKEVQELNAIGIALSAERNPSKLLEMILRKIREITAADAGTLYLVEEVEEIPPKGNNYFANKRLRFKLIQNDTKQVPFREFTMEVNENSIAGYVALSRAPLNIPDVYELPLDSKFSFNISFDRTVGYRTKSMLVMPMINHQDQVIGVIQLINKKRNWHALLVSQEAIDNEVISFDRKDEELAYSLASQAAVSLENTQLYEDIKKLFEGFIRASVIAIESRDPTTSGHSERVAILTVGLAEEVDRISIGPYRHIKFSREDIQQIRYASLLHDFGKIGVRENVLLKAKKLQPLELEIIKSRFRFIRRSIELKHFQEKVDYLLKKDKTEALKIFKNLDEDLKQQLAELDGFLEFLLQVNEPTVYVENVESEKLQKISQLIAEDYDGTKLPLITPDEIVSLSISQGSLNFEEREEIATHVVHTFKFLSQIPWTKDLKQVPDIAYSHHEKLNGTGYPRKLKDAQISIQARMMTVSDIYDALIARDRPYKPAVPIEKALEILEAEVNQGRLDEELFRIFVGTKVYQQVKKE